MASCESRCAARQGATEFRPPDGQADVRWFNSTQIRLVGRASHVRAFRIRQGDIFWLDGCRPLRGDVAKRRPVIVITPDDLVETAPEILIIACTTSVLASDKT